jgi:hypothetical protein
VIEWEEEEEEEVEISRYSREGKKAERERE